MWSQESPLEADCRALATQEILSLFLYPSPHSSGGSSACLDLQHPLQSLGLQGSALLHGFLAVRLHLYLRGLVFPILLFPDGPLGVGCV